jgi:hypothetical protein
VKRPPKGKKHAKTITIGTARFSTPPDKATNIEMKLNALGRALLKAHRGDLLASLTVLKSAPTPAQKRTQNVRLIEQKALKAKSRTS